MNFELTELYESYTAADKYLLHDFHRTFFDYVKSKLDVKSSCLIYDLLVKIGEREESPLACVKAQIIENSKKVFESEHFTQIHQETLISLLSLDQLDIDETDLLAAVSKWVNDEMQRQGLSMNDENRRRVFEPIKGYVLFAALTPEQIASEVVAQLLTDEERESLHQLDRKKAPMIELKTSRRAGYVERRAFINNTNTLYLIHMQMLNICALRF